MSSLPFVQEMSPAPDVADTFRKLANRPGLILFDSSLRRSPLGRYSFLTAEPFHQIQIREARYGTDPFEDLVPLLNQYQTSSIPDLPPFQGGVAGLLSYELGHCFERLPVCERDEFRIPAAVLGLYSWVLAWDHEQQRCWFIAHGDPEPTEKARLDLARFQWEFIQQRLAEPEPPEMENPNSRNSSHETGVSPFSSERLLDSAFKTHDHELALLPLLRSNFTRQEYLHAVQDVIEYIAAGDLFQANLSQRLLLPARSSPVMQYLKLRSQNPAPFAGYFAHDDWVVMSSSPERFLQLNGRRAATRPIKGTRQRGFIPEADLYTRDELRESEKDRAENMMIVDLLRNDLSRVCLPGSIQVPELCSVEAYETVSHLVSEVQGTLRAGETFWSLLKATFPGGSITGAPKIRAMQVISELEQVARGPYCGSLFYHGFDGTADSNILIRTMTQRFGWLTFSAGGGIITQSDPVAEYEETLHKVRGMLNALA